MTEFAKNQYFEYTNCLVCNSASRKKIYKIGSPLNEEILNSIEKPEVFMYKCNHCGHFYKNPILNDDFMSHYYSELNSVFYKTRTPGVDRNRHKANVKIVETIEKYKKRGNVLEIGCGYGFLLSCFDAERWHRFGIEPSPHASEFARLNHGLDVFTGLLENHPYEKESFDAIVLIDVFEHIRNPVELFKNIAYLLKPQGIIYLKTGSIERLLPRLAKGKWTYANFWEHLSFLTSKSIQYLLSNFNLKLVKKENISHYPILRINLYWLVQDIVKNIIKLSLNTLFGKEKFKIRVPVVFDHIFFISEK